MHRRLLTRVRAVNIWLIAPLLGLSVFLAVLLSTAAPLAQAATASTNLNFQARLLTSSGGIVPDGNYNIDFKLYTADGVTGTVGTCTGSCVWEEKRTVFAGNGVPVVNGYFSVNLGSVTAFPSTINWDQQLWLTMNLTTNGTQATNPITTDWNGEMQNGGHSIQLTSVPAAFRANQLGNVVGGNEQQLVFAASYTQATTITLPDPGAGTATVCYQNATACGFATGTTGSYIQNQVASLQAANFRIQSAANGSVGATIEGAAGQTADLFDLINGASSTNVLTVSAAGATIFQNSTDSATGFAIKNSGGTQVLGVDTTNLSVNVTNLQATGTISLQGPDGGSILLRTDANSGIGANAMTFSGNEITDDSRSLSLQGDGRQPPDSSTGIWEAATNMLTDGGFENITSGWTTSSGNTTSFTSDTSTAKFGSYSAKAVVNASGASGIRTTGTALTSGQPYSVSAWVKGTAGKSLALQLVRADFSTIVAQASFTATGGWQYVTVSTTSYPATETGYIYIKTTAAGADSFWADGVQLENKMISTPYVDTNGGTAARAAARVQAPVPTGATQGWFAARVRFGFNSSAVTSLGAQAYSVATISQDANNFLTLFYRAGDSSWRMRATVAGASTGDATIVKSQNAGDLVTVIGYYTSTQVAVSVNGGVFTVLTPSSMPTLSSPTFDIGNLRGGSQLDGDIIWTAAGTGTLSNADAASINRLGSSDPSISGLISIDSASVPSFTWDGESNQYSGTNNDQTVQSGISIDDFTLYHTGAGALALQGGVNSATAFQVLDTSGNSFLTVDTSTPGVSIGATGSLNKGSTIQIADTNNGTGTQGVTIGSNANAANSVIIDAGNTGAIAIGNSTSAHTINIGSGSGTSVTQTVNIGNGSSSSSGGVAVNIANGNPGLGTNDVIQIGTGGSTNGTVNVTIGSNGAVGHTTVIQGGNGTIAGTGAAIKIQAQAAGDILIGATAATGQIVVGSSSSANNVLIANGSGASTVSIANVQTGGAVNIGTAMTTGTILVGNTGTTTVQGGTTTLKQISGANSTTLAFQAPTAAVTYNLQTATAGSYNICTSVSSSACSSVYAPATGGTGYVQLAPSSAQSDSSTNSSIFINKSSTGNLLQLQQSSSNKFVVDNSGNLTANGTYNTNTFSSGTLQFGVAGTATVKAASGQSLQLQAGDTSHFVLLQNAGGDVAIGNITPQAALDISGGISIRGYVTSNTSNTNNGQWTELGSCTVQVQFAGCDALIQIVGGIANGNAGGDESVNLNWRVKQQNALGGVPVIQLEAGDFTGTSGISVDDFATVTTQNDASATVVQLWGKIDATFQAWHFSPSLVEYPSTGNLTFLSTQGFSVSLPVGTQTAAVYKSFQAGSNTTPSITFAGNLSTGIYQPATNVIGFTTNGTERLAIDASGNANLITGGLQINGSTAIDTSRNFIGGTVNTDTIGASTLTFSGASPTISNTGTGTITLQAASTGTLLLNTSGAGTVSLGTSNTTTIGIGNTSAAVTITGNNTTGAVSVQAAASGTILIGTTNNNAITLGGNVAASKDVSIAGSLATQHGTDYSTTGTSNNVNFGDVSLVRLTGASQQTITGIANGRDGYVLTVVNAGSNSALLKNNDSTDSSASNIIMTGTGTDMSLAVNASVELIYDSQASVWRAISGNAGAASGSGYSLENHVVVTSGTTFTPDTGVTALFVQAIGGGGGSGGGNSSGHVGAGTAGGGGGSGAYSTVWVTSNISGTLTIQIGSGGTAGSTAPGAGGSGGETFLKDSTSVKVVGAGGGTGAAGVASTSGEVYGLGGAGGTVTAGTGWSGQSGIAASPTQGVGFGGYAPYGTGPGSGANGVSGFQTNLSGSAGNAGTLVIDEYVPATGSGGISGSYIQNGTSTQTANFNVQSSSSSSITAVIQGAAGQSVDILKVQDSSSDNLLQVDQNGDITLQNATNNANALQILNASGAEILGIDTTANNGNLITNSDFEANATGWTSKGTSTAPTNTTAQFYQGNHSGTTTVSAASSGMQYNFTFSASTQYQLTFYARCSSTITTFTYGRQDNGSDINNTTTATCSSSGWTAFTWHFTTGGTIGGTPNIYMTEGSTTSGTIYIDAVSLIQTTTNAFEPYENGAIQINGTINTPTIIMPQANSTNAFAVQNTTGTTSELSVDTLNNRVNIVLAPTSSYGANLNVGGTTTTRSNSTTAFQIQSSNGNLSDILNIDTSTTNNLITNSDFEANGTSGWAVKNGATLSRVTTQQWQGNGSLQVAGSASANSGASYNFTMSTGTQYTLSLYAKVASGSISDFIIGRQDVSGTDILCFSGANQTLTTSWTRFVCTFTTGGTITSSNIFVQKTGGVAETFFIDGVQLQTGSSATPYNPGGAIQLEGIVNSPAAFQNKNDSTTAFQIQNAAGTNNLLVADTLDSVVGIGQAPIATGSTLQVSGSISATSAIGFTNTGNANQALTINMVVTSAVTAGDVVVIDTSNPGQVTDSTTSNSTTVVGIATQTQSAGVAQPIVISGVYQVNVTGTVNVGDYLVTSSTTGQASDTTSPSGGVIGQAMSTASSGQAWALIKPQSGAGGSGSGTSNYQLMESDFTNSNGATIPATLSQTSTVTVGNYVYLIGGWNGSATSRAVYQAPVSNPTSWTLMSSTALPAGLAGSQVAIIGSTVYLFGGTTSSSNSSATNVIYSISTSNIGTATAWTNAGTISVATSGLAYSQVAIIGSYVYLFGGQSSTAGSIATIFQASLSNPLSWSTNGTLPIGVGGSQLAVIGNYVYLFGGVTTAQVNTIWRAQVANPTTTWTNMGNQLPGNIVYSSLTIIGNYVYLLGGWNTSFVSVIYKAPVNNPVNGWSNAGSTLPGVLGSPSLAIEGNAVYLFGGATSGSNAVNTIYSAPIVNPSPDLTSNPSWKVDENFVGSGSGTSSQTANGNFQLDYAQITSPVTSITGSDKLIVSGNSVTYDGNTSVEVIFYTPGWLPGGNGSAAQGYINLYEDGTNIGEMANCDVSVAGTPSIVCPTEVSTILTPTAGAHTFSIESHSFTGFGTIEAGSGGSGVYLPAFIRIVRANPNIQGGSGINNGTTTQTANFNIQSSNASNVTAVIQGAASQSADILDVRNSSSTNLLSVDPNGNLSVAGNIGFTNTGNANQALTINMVVTSSVNAGDVVVIDTSNAGQVTDSAAANSTQIVGIATQTNGAGVAQPIVISGIYQVNVTGTVTVGDYLVTSSTAGTAQDTTSPSGGVIGQAMSTASSGKAWALIKPQSGAGGGSGSSANGILAVQTFTSGSGTFTVPAGVTAIQVELVGAGGAGGGSSVNTMGGGGGGGGYVKKLITNPVSSYSYSVGGGGSGSSGANGTAGTSTTFGSLTGGGGGFGSFGSNGGAGGTASGGDVNIPGQIGMYPAGSSFGGSGGSSQLGPGALDPDGTGAGQPGASYGGGGSGANYNGGPTAAGGNGAGGVVVITEYGPTGNSSSGSSSSNYELMESDWASSGTLPASLHDSQFVQIANTLYIFGGNNGTNLTHIYTAPVSNPNSWTDQGAKLPSLGVEDSQVAIIGSKVYLFGGYNGTSAISTIYEAPTSDPINSWTTAAGTLPGALMNSQVAIIGSFVYLFGGGNAVNTASNVIYRASLSNPDGSGAWTSAGTLSQAIFASQLAVIGNYVYLLGGNIGAGAATNSYRAPVSNPLSWSSTGNVLNTAMEFHNLLAVGNTLYLLGGSTSGTIVQKTPTNSPLSGWGGTTTLPTSCLGNAAIVGNAAYMFGGGNNCGGSSSIISTPIVNGSPDLTANPSWKVDQNFAGSGSGTSSQTSSSSTTGFYPDSTGSLTTGLTAYWKLDENSGSTVKDSVGTNYGVATGTTVVAGKINNARNFASSTDVINVGNGSTINPINVNDPFSISTWIKSNNGSTCTTGGTGGDGIFAGGTNGVVFYLVNGTCTIGLSKNGVSSVHSTSTITDTSWHHVVVVFTGSQVYFYKDGVADASNPQAYAPSFAGGITYGIGSVPGTTTNWFNGTIDEVGYWKAALSSSEVTDLYNSGNGNTYNASSNGTASTSYIQNGTTVQTANFNIQSASSFSVTATIQGAGSQTADILDVKDSSNNILFGVAPTGVITLGPASATPDILVLGTKNTTGDPTCTTSGSIYYNSTDQAFRACTNGNWTRFGSWNYNKTTSKTVNNTVTETDLLNGEVTIPANAFGTNRTLHLYARGDFMCQSNNANGPRFKVKLGGTTLIDTGQVGAIGSSTSHFGWTMDVTISELGATNSQWVALNGTITFATPTATAGFSTAFTTGEGFISQPYSNPNGSNFQVYEGGNSGTVDTTSSQALVFSVINGTAATTYETVLKAAEVTIQ